MSVCLVPLRVPLFVESGFCRPGNLPELLPRFPVQVYGIGPRLSVHAIFVKKRRHVCDGGGVLLQGLKEPDAFRDRLAVDADLLQFVKLPVHSDAFIADVPLRVVVFDNNALLPPGVIRAQYNGGFVIV